MTTPKYLSQDFQLPFALSRINFIIFIINKNEWQNAFDCIFSSLGNIFICFLVESKNNVQKPSTSVNAKPTF